MNFVMICWDSTVFHIWDFLNSTNKWREHYNNEHDDERFGKQCTAAYALVDVRLAGRLDQSGVVFTCYDSWVGSRTKSNMFDSSDRRSPDRSARRSHRAKL